MSPNDEAEQEYMSRVPYANVVSSLIHAMVCSRPDISQAIRVISRYMHNPGKEHWQAVKWILWYIHNTVDVGLVFEKECNQSVIGYCDSDFAGDLGKRRSTTALNSVSAFPNAYAWNALSRRKASEKCFPEWVATSN
ncbi:secreted RxLR effector protein 161-like [Nicotiana sylvestris]|uniref:secreted RxLR effector protein 161-like n=1 Tax=Nicotiana sylvestris TaxID=4096 RepID=UPI00388CDB4C